MNKLIAITFLVFVSQSHAGTCPYLGREIALASKDQVRIFTAQGRLERSTAARDLLPGHVTACNSALGLLQLELADGARVWVDPIDLAISS